MIRPSELFEEKIIDILGADNKNGIKANIFIGSYDNPDLKVIPFTVERIIISQRYTLNTMNDIKLFAKFHIKDILTIIREYNSLYVSLTIKYVDPQTGDEDLDEDIIQKFYNLYIPNLEDLYKKFNVNQISPEENDVTDQHVGTLLPIVLQLLEIESFNIRKRRLNLILQQVSIKDAVLFVAYNLGFEKINYIDDFNPSVYQNFHIPINHSRFDVIYDYIQNTYGIYDKGFNYYFDNKVLYLYPQFDTEFYRKNESVLHIYKVAPTSYDGTRNFHKFIDNDLHVVSNSMLDNRKLSGISLENEGTNRIFLDTKSLVDRTIEIYTDGKIYIKDNLINISTENENKLFKNTVSVDYCQPSLNLCYNSSIIAERNTEILMLEWTMARPFQLIPGNRVKFHYEREDEIITKDGLIENSEYILNKIPQVRTNDEDFFVCNAKFTIRIHENK